MRESFSVRVFPKVKGKKERIVIGDDSSSFSEQYQALANGSGSGYKP
jgi:hypothetical protein